MGSGGLAPGAPLRPPGAAATSLGLGGSVFRTRRALPVCPSRSALLTSPGSWVSARLPQAKRERKTLGICLQAAPGTGSRPWRAELGGALLLVAGTPGEKAWGGGGVEEHYWASANGVPKNGGYCLAIKRESPLPPETENGYLERYLHLCRLKRVRGPRREARSVAWGGPQQAFRILEGVHDPRRGTACERWELPSWGFRGRKQGSAFLRGTRAHGAGDGRRGVGGSALLRVRQAHPPVSGGPASPMRSQASSPE